MPEVELCVQYFVSGYSVGGTTKEFVYSTTVGKQFEVIENRELNSIYQEPVSYTHLVCRNIPMPTKRICVSMEC